MTTGRPSSRRTTTAQRPERVDEVLLNDGDVAGRRVAETQRQNSRVRTRREKKCLRREWCLDVVEWPASPGTKPTRVRRGAAAGVADALIDVVRSDARQDLIKL